MLTTLAAVPPGAFWLPKSIQNAYESIQGMKKSSIQMLRKQQASKRKPFGY
jgi:hypothetical protein